jgi:hypothetical protein
MPLRLGRVRARARGRDELRAHRRCEKLDEVAARYPPRVPVDLDAIADQGLAVYEGTFVLSRALDEPGLLRRQLRLFRTSLELLFAPGPGAAAGSP